MRAMGLAEVIIDGEVIEADPPHRLVQTYRFLFTDQNKAEGFTRLTWEIELTPGGFTRLTVTHDLTGAPMGAGMVTSKFSNQGGGGWNWILSDLKSLLETLALPLDGGGLGGGERSVFGEGRRRRRRPTTFFTQTRREHPQPCPSPIEGGFLRAGPWVPGRLRRPG